MTPGHALLSASSSGRWLNCPGSVYLTKDMPDQTSDYAEAGRLAHSIGELKLRKRCIVGIGPKKYKSEMDKLEESPFYDPEMQSTTDEYVDFVEQQFISYPEKPYITVENDLRLIPFFGMMWKKGVCRMGLFGKKKEINPNDIYKAVSGGAHMAGLPLPEGSRCSIMLYPDRLQIAQNESTFKLPIERLHDICIKDAVEIQNQYVSSIGGAVGGALLFGPLGAMVGGRAKNKAVKTQQHYLIISYEKDGALEYISFDCTNANDLMSARTLQKAFSPTRKAIEVEL